MGIIEEYRLYPRETVELVDLIVKISNGVRDKVNKEADWAVIEKLMEFYALKWPLEANSFLKTVKEIKKSRREKGLDREKNIKYLAALPEDNKLLKMIKVIFPYQEFNKDFFYKLTKRFPYLRVGG